MPSAGTVGAMPVHIPSIQTLSFTLVLMAFTPDGNKIATSENEFIFRLTGDYKIIRVE